jgi:hypothetical protein
MILQVLKRNILDKIEAFAQYASDTGYKQMKKALDMPYEYDFKLTIDYLDDGSSALPKNVCPNGVYPNVPYQSFKNEIKDNKIVLVQNGGILRLARMEIAILS